VNAGGNAQVTTSNFKYGNGAATFTGGSDGLSVSGDWRQTGDFTIELWVYLTSTPTNPWSRIVAMLGSDTASRYRFNFDNTNRLVYNLYGSGSYPILTDAIPLNTWTHVAISRAGSNIRGFVNGVLNYTRTLSGTLGHANGLGVWYLSGAQNAPGLIDEYRFTQGVARYTTNFTPPDKAFPNN
jgi:hypothetical protein